MFKKITIISIVLMALMFFVVINVQKKHITMEDEIINLVKEYQGVSKITIIQIMLRRGYNLDDIREKIDILNINWKHQALMMGWKLLQFDLKKDEMIKCLKFQKFTDEEVNYAINQIFKK